jgi:hypothetical protein
LRDLSADNSKGDLCIEKFLIKSEKAFFVEVKKEKISAMSIRSSRDSFIQSRAPSMIEGFRPECESKSHTTTRRVDRIPDTLDSSRDSTLAPYSMSGHGHEDTMANDYGGGGDMYDDGGHSDARMTKLQIFMGRSIAGWPLYTIIISLGQLLSAVGYHSGMSNHVLMQFLDVFPIEFTFWVEYRNRGRPVYHLFNLCRRYTRLVHPLQDEAFRLGSYCSLVNVGHL